MKQADRRTHFEALEVNGVTRFINQCCVFGSVIHTSAKELYETYFTWCDTPDKRFCLVGKNRFSTVLEEQANKAGHTVVRFRTSSMRGWQGIGLISSGHDRETEYPQLIENETAAPTEIINSGMGYENEIRRAMQQFVNERCAIGTGEFSSPSNLYRDYILWTEQYSDSLKLLCGIREFVPHFVSVLNNQGSTLFTFQYKGRKAWRGVGLTEKRDTATSKT